MSTVSLHNQLKVDKLSQFISNLDLHYISNGAFEYNNHVDFPTFNDGYYRIYYLVDGEIEFHSYSKTRVFKAGDVIIFSPDIIITSAGGTNAKVYYINFEMRNISFDSAFNTFIHDTFPDYCVKDVDNTLLKLFELSCQEAHDQAIGSYYKNQLLLGGILLRMIRHSREESQKISSYTETVKHSEDYYNTALHYIQSHISSKIEIADLAKHLGISEIYLYKIFKKQTNESPQQFIMRYRLHRATHYLANPKTPIKTISDMLGFNTPSHFSVAFKKYLKITPAEYRKKALSNM